MEEYHFSVFGASLYKIDFPTEIEMEIQRHKQTNKPGNQSELNIAALSYRLLITCAYFLFFFFFFHLRFIIVKCHLSYILKRIIFDPLSSNSMFLPINH